MYRIATVGGLVAMILSVPLAMILPTSIAFENGPIENLQVIILFGSSIFALRLMSSTIDQGTKAFNIFCSLLFILLAVRELSWGRVFYQIDFSDSGPTFIAMKDYAWRLEAHVFIVLIVLAMLILLVRRVPLRRLWTVPLPIKILSLIFLCVILQYIGEHGYIFGKLNGQTLEEFNETIIYCLQPMLCLYYNDQLNRLQAL